jgi:hypothetical protein
MSVNDDANFLKNTMYDRVKSLVGGNPDRIESWWDTPLAQAPFNLRAPNDLINPTEWKLVYHWLLDAVRGEYPGDIDFLSQSEQTGYSDKRFTEYLIDDRPYGYGGTESLLHIWNNSNVPVPAYRVHRFNSTGQFFLERSGIIEYLIVGGGGGGGGSDSLIPGGGGGAGGVLMGSIRLDAGYYDAVVGAGGSSGNEQGAARASSNGGRTTFWKFVAFGGGAGAHRSTAILEGSPLSGSSGGGGCPPETTLNTGLDRNQNRQFGAAGIAGQGFAGGNASSYAFRNAGGGGGAGGVGTAGAEFKAGDGGPGIASDITGTIQYYGGGGAGGTGNGTGNPRGGAGGIGGGASTPDYINTLNTGASAPSNATANTGGGGGGGHFGNSGSFGGSGVIILRYRLTV